MKRWGKIYSLVAITLLLVVIIVLQIYFKQLYGQSIPSPAVRQNIKAVGQEATASDTSNWKTYKDTSLDFELKYPVDFEVLNNPSKFPVVKYNGDMVVLQKQTTYPDGEVDTASVALKKVHTSLKKVIADEFDWSVRSVRFENNKFVIERDANTACYIARDYLIPKQNITQKK